MIALVSITGNQTTLTTGPSMIDFIILKAFHVHTHPPKASKIQELFWCPPQLNWIKCNTNGSTLRNPGSSSCAGIFRDNAGDYIDCFATNLGT